MTRVKSKYVKRLRLPGEVWEQIGVTARLGQATEEEVMAAAWDHFARLAPDLRRQLAWEWWYRGAYGPEVTGRRRRRAYHARSIRQLVRRGLASVRRVLDWAGRDGPGPQ